LNMVFGYYEKKLKPIQELALHGIEVTEQRKAEREMMIAQAKKKGVMAAKRKVTFLMSDDKVKPFFKGLKIKGRTKRLSMF